MQALLKDADDAPDLEMAKDAQRLVAGELDEADFYERYHDAVTDEFGVDRSVVKDDDSPVRTSTTPPSERPPAASTTSCRRCRSGRSTVGSRRTPSTTMRTSSSWGPTAEAVSIDTCSAASRNGFSGLRRHPS